MCFALSILPSLTVLWLFCCLVQIEVGNKHNAKVTFNVENTGSIAGADVPQLYLNFPESAGEPLWQLKGFNKTKVLQPQESVTVEIDTVARDVSIWDVATHDWKIIDGVYGVAVGASSRDHRLTGTMRQH